MDRDKHANHPCGKHRFGHVIHRKPPGTGRPDTCPGKCPAGPGSRRGDYHSHGALDLHHGRDVEDHSIQYTRIKKTTVLHLRHESPGLISENPVCIFSALDTLKYGLLHDANKFLHPLEHLIVGRVTSGTLVMDGQFP